jgi:hypothetical protein
MLRISAGVSLCFTLLAVGGGLAACSSDSTDGGGTAGKSSSGGTSSTGGTGGKGSVITGGDDSGGTGTGGGRAGSTSTGGTGGTAATDCANAPVVCVDAETASTCDPDTMMDVTIKCKEDAAELGLISNGCEGDALEGGCTIDDFADQGCADGTSAAAACEGITDDGDLLNLYINCYTDYMGAKDIVTCYGTHVTGTMVDCAAAEAECFGGGGGDGAGGAAAGGAPG